MACVLFRPGVGDPYHLTAAYLWSAFQHRTIYSVELPPASFFLSDPLLVGLAVFALVQLVTIARR